MRKFVIAAVLAASALTAAAPAAAQYYPQPQGYGHGYYGNNWGQVRRLQVRVDQLQRQIHHLDRRNILSNDEASRLRGDARNVELRLRSAARHGLSGRESYEIERRIYRLEARIQRDARDGNRWGRYGYNDDRAGWSDRDRDGRNDRYENDRGYDHDD